MIAPPVQADDAQKLEREARALNSASPSSQQAQARLRSLAREYGVSITTIEEARKQKLGWGDLTIRLAMAHHYASSSSGGRTTEQAFAEIGRLRTAKQAWGQVAHELGIQIGPVLRLVERGKASLRTADTRHAKGEQSPVRTQPKVSKGKAQASSPGNPSASPAARPMRKTVPPAAPAHR